MEHREGEGVEAAMTKLITSQTKHLLIIIVVLAVVSPLAANDFNLPPGKWWEDQRLVSRIGLTEEQQEQIRDVVFEHARRMIDLKADVDKAGLDLASSVDQKIFDPVPVRAAYANFQTARQKLENERFEMLLAVRQVLTYEQWQKIEEIKRRMKQMRSDRRPGARGQEGQRPQGDRAPGF
jgi:Spy/CpxP family protein refolding chaperone